MNEKAGSNFYRPATNASARVPRRLGDEVLQSAEEAVLVQAATAGDEALLDLQASYAASRSAHAQDQRLAPSSCTNAIKRYVADQPLQSALLAAAAGALAMLLIRSQLTKRTGAGKWTRMR